MAMRARQEVGQRTNLTKSRKVLLKKKQENTAPIEAHDDSVPVEGSEAPAPVEDEKDVAPVPKEEREIESTGKSSLPEQSGNEEQESPSQEDEDRLEKALVEDKDEATPDKGSEADASVDDGKEADAAPLDQASAEEKEHPSEENSGEAAGESNGDQTEQPAVETDQETSNEPPRAPNDERKETRIRAPAKNDKNGDGESQADEEGRIEDPKTSESPTSDEVPPKKRRGGNDEKGKAKDQATSKSNSASKSTGSSKKSEASATPQEKSSPWFFGRLLKGTPFASSGDDDAENKASSEQDTELNSDSSAHIHAMMGDYMQQSFAVQQAMRETDADLNKNSLVSGPSNEKKLEDVPEDKQVAAASDEAYEAELNELMNRSLGQNKLQSDDSVSTVKSDPKKSQWRGDESTASQTSSVRRRKQMTEARAQWESGMTQQSEDRYVER